MEIVSQKGGKMRHDETINSQVGHKCLCYTVIGAVLFILLLALPFLYDRAHAEPQRLTTPGQRAKIAAKKEAKVKFPEAEHIDKVFPDKNQADIIKALIEAVNAGE